MREFYTNVLIEGVLVLGFFAAILYTRAFDYMTLGTVIAFISQICLMIFFANHEEMTSSPKVLFLTVFVYSLALGGIFMSISDYFAGDTFMLSKGDAMAYYKESMKVSQMGYIEGAKHLMSHHDYDDWGSYFFDSFMMSLIRDKLFLNFAYMLLGACASVFLFKIGRNYMPDIYAFLAGLAYGTSSYMIFFHCSFLKESLFVFLVIAAMYNANQFIRENRQGALAAALLCLVCILFFRPVVAAFEIAGLSVYYGIKLKGRAISLFLYMMGAVILAVSMKSLQDISNTYTADGDIDRLIAYSGRDEYSGGFNYFVCFFGAFLGPFPTLFSKIVMNPSPIQFYGAGLTHKLFLAIPLWIGVFFAIKKWVIELFPLIVFCLMEMFATAYICDSLELRKVLLHVPFTYILAFYGLSHLSNNMTSTKIAYVFTYIFPIGVLFLWNLIRA